MQARAGNRLPKGKRESRSDKQSNNHLKWRTYHDKITIFMFICSYFTTAILFIGSIYPTTVSAR